MMACDQRNVIHTCILCHAYPLCCIKIDRVKKIHQPCIIFYSDVARLHYPLTVAGNTKRSPMNKQSKFCIIEPFTCIKILLCGSILLCLERIKSKKKNGSN